MPKVEFRHDRDQHGNIKLSCSMAVASWQRQHCLMPPSGPEPDPGAIQVGTAKQQTHNTTARRVWGSQAPVDPQLPMTCCLNKVIPLPNTPCCVASVAWHRQNPPDTVAHIKKHTHTFQHCCSSRFGTPTMEAPGAGGVLGFQVWSCNMSTPEGFRV